ncbi:MAG: class I SAM-dependent methyltransferase [Myxococcota bacterium]|nr:class I SAM-dependent methyltransferase [Myxococcota bacterium]
MKTDAEFWNRAAEKYAAKPVSNVAAFERKKEITRALLAPDQTLFEHGCGTGSLALELAPHVAHVHAMDISAEMVRIARGKAEAQGVDNVTFHVGTLEGGAPLAAGEADGVAAFNILHLVEDRPGVLRTLFELLAPGGFFVSSTACLGETWMPLPALIGVLRLIGRAPRVWSFDKATLRREMEEAGFVDVTEHDVGADAMTAFVVAAKPG